MTIEVGQVYTSCNPRYTITVRVVAYRPGQARASVVDAETGKRPRSILAKNLHASRLTGRGEPRKTGYRPVKDVPDA